jgi:predicted dithiol-disulfide oxidoreductase (DUF899 family)
LVIARAARIWAWEDLPQPARVKFTKRKTSFRDPRANERRTMGITFPGESPEYRAARDRLLEQELELRRSMEAVAAARRQLPPGGVVPEDYVFQGHGVDGKPTDVRLSELFARGRDSLVRSRAGLSRSAA